MVSKLPDANCFNKTVLLSCTGLYTILNTILSIIATVAWCKGRAKVHSEECLTEGPECGITRWLLYFFMAAASAICTITTSMMFFYGYFHTKGTIFNPLYIFRGVVFTIIISAPLLFVGWSSLPTNNSQAVTQQLFQLAMSECPDTDANPFSSSSPYGLTGTFILEILEKDFKSGKSAFIMSHLNLGFGALLAGMSAAMSPATGFIAPSSFTRGV